MSALDEVSIIPSATAEKLNERQLIDYRHERVECLEWLLGLGKNPDRAEGYARAIVQNQPYGMDQVYRWVWNEEDRYPTDVTRDHADEYLRHLAACEKSAINNDRALKALQSPFKWRHHRRGGEQWEPKVRLSTLESVPAPSVTSPPLTRSVHASAITHCPVHNGVSWPSFCHDLIDIINQQEYVSHQNL